MVGIIRVDNGKARQHGYLARIEHRGRKHSKWFGDWTHGSSARALRAAERWMRATRTRVGSALKWEEVR